MSPPVAHRQLNADLISEHPALWDFYQYISEHRGREPKPENIRVLPDSAQVFGNGSGQLALYYADESCASLGDSCQFFAMRLTSLANATEMAHGWGRLTMTDQGPWIISPDQKPLQRLDPQERTEVPQLCSTMHVLGGQALANLKCEDPPSLQEKTLANLSQGLLSYFLWDLSAGPLRVMMGGPRGSFPMTRYLWKSANQVLDRVPKSVGPAYLVALAYDQSAAAAGIEQDNPWREQGTPVVGVASWAGLSLYQARMGVALSDMGWKGALATRLGNGLLAVGLIDSGVAWLGGDTYEAALQSRVTDYAYARDDQEIKQLGEDGRWGKAAGLFLAHFFLHKMFRAIVPSMMEWATSHSNPEVVTQLSREDRENCVRLKQALWGVLSELSRLREQRGEELDFSFLTARADTGALHWTPLLRQVMGEGVSPAEFSALIKSTGLTEEEINVKIELLLLKDFQDAIAALYAIELPVNDWVRDCFHPNGTLKSGYEVDLLEHVLGPQESWPRHIQKAMQSLQLRRELETREITDPERAHAHGL